MVLMELTPIVFVEYSLYPVFCFDPKKNYDENKTMDFWFSTSASAVLFSPDDGFCGSTLPVFTLNDVLYYSQIIVFYDY